MTEAFMINDVRWQCAGCGRFVSESAVHGEDYLDPGAYYGVGSRTWADCARCGSVDDPKVVIVRTAEWTGAPQ